MNDGVAGFSDYSCRATTSGVFLSNLITITGQTGVGTSSAMKFIKELHREQGGSDQDRWRYVSAGEIMRSFADELGMSIEDFVVFRQAHPKEKYDERCDEEMCRHGKRNFSVLEGRLPHIFVPQAFHVLLVCSIDVRTSRRRDDFPDLSFTEIKDIISQRDVCDEACYRELYPSYMWRRDDFDLTIETDNFIQECVARMIWANHAEWRKKKEKQGRILETV